MEKSGESKEGYFRVIISATSEAEAKKILRALLENHLAAGGLIVKGPSGYWWKGKIVEEEYFSLSAYTLGRHKDRIIEAVRSLHSDEVPIIEFYRIEYANLDFLRWVDEYTS